jgi:hypothetical protein
MSKFLFSMLALAFAGCVTRHAALVSRAADVVGSYSAEFTVDTIEELELQPDGKFTFRFCLVGDKDEWYEGRWELRDGRVTLWAKDSDGNDVEFPLEIEIRKDALRLIYSEESFAHAKATMILPNAYRRISPKPLGISRGEPRVPKNPD